MRIPPLRVLPSLLLLAAAPATSLAAGVASLRCVRYTPTLNTTYVPIAGTGFTPGQSEGVRLSWSGDRGIAGFGATNAGGGFAGRFLGPDKVISSRIGFQRTYTLFARDETNPALVASTRVTFVHAGLTSFPRRSKPHGIRTYRFYGFPSGKRIWAHYFFGGRLRGTRLVGRVRSACGDLRHRMPLIPGGVRARVGTWKVRFSNARRYTRRSTLLVEDFFIFTYVK